MITHYRQAFNRQFSTEKYAALLEWIAQQYQHRPPFKICETPVFIDAILKRQLLEACNDIVDILVDPAFLSLSEAALLPAYRVPNETPHTTFLAIDFGICQLENGTLIPQLIEIQGFPSLFHYQNLIAKGYKKHFDIPDHLNYFFNDLKEEDYLELLRAIIVGDQDPKNVVLLEIEPYQQPTAIDFLVAEAALGIKVLCISKIIKDGRQLFYEENGKKIPIKRIYNRVIFDELAKRTDLKREFSFLDEVDVDWVGHPNWFFRISKHALPLFESKYVPPSYLISELDEIPADLSNYVLKPLFSFSGAGVIIDVSPTDLETIDDPSNYLLQRKVNYAPIIETLDQPAKCEIRLLLAWERNAPRPTLVTNLCRLSKGAMIGVRYNKNKTWVGGSVGFFE